MSANVEIMVGFGTANFSTEYRRVGANKVEPPWRRVSAATSGRRVSGSGATIMPGRIENHGMFYQSRVEHPAGTIILMEASWKQGGIPRCDGAIFIRLRSTGPSWRIKANLPLSQENNYGGDVEVFFGRGDILSFEELAEHNIVPAYFRGYEEKWMTPEEVDMCFNIDQVDAGSAARPEVVTVTTDTGHVRTVEVAPTPRRRIILRR